MSRLNMELNLKTVSNSVNSREKYAADLEQALSVAGVGWYNIKYCLVLALFLISALIETMGYAYLLPAAKCDLKMSDAQRGIIASLPYIAVVVTSFPWGYLVDTRGRKTMIIYSSVLCGTFGILSAFMPELISFTTCKFLASICMACPAAAPYTFIGEILPQKHRDLALSITNAMQTLGSALVPLLAWGIIPLPFRAEFGVYAFRSWRLLVIVYSSFFIISACLMSFGPESPKYLVSQGKYDEALAVIETMYAANKGKLKDEFPIKVLKIVEDSKREKVGFITSLKVQSLPLMRPPYAKWMALNGFLLFGVFSTLNGLYMWIPDILNRVLSEGRDGVTACEVIAQRLNETQEAEICNDSIDQVTFFVNAIASLSCAIISLLVSSTLKIIGKKVLLVLVYFILGSFCISINFIRTSMVFAVLLSALQMVAVAVGPVNAYAVEIFPTHLRGMAVSLAIMLGRIGSILGTNLAGILINATCETTFYFFGGLLLVCGFMAFLLPKAESKICCF
ncbi:putative transporter SVOPL [Leguminivora glycinivorella]|uniref:putative transporter SVOPL n=1 Tax=Leguminivora glycinivorella TaxID=1035111 RepID=UPI00200CE816|nr:putative transporter SVOPL [Leguminivora glycinivorella]